MKAGPALQGGLAHHRMMHHGVAPESGHHFGFNLAGGAAIGRGTNGPRIVVPARQRAAS